LIHAVHSARRLDMYRCFIDYLYLLLLHAGCQNLDKVHSLLIFFFVFSNFDHEIVSDSVNELSEFSSRVEFWQN